jgi:hypothetical protein
MSEQIEAQVGQAQSQKSLIAFLKQNKSEAFNLYESIISELLYKMQFDDVINDEHYKIYVAYYLGLANGYFDGLLKALYEFDRNAKTDEYIKDLNSRVAEKIIEFINDLANIYYKIINRNEEITKIYDQLHYHKNRVEISLSRYLSDISDILEYLKSENKS